ncbi:hypothetical protein Tco_1015430 [Tanacetum coccineum]|uniref:Reverse transcriptase Ty1/copia-type domain-containing protein n=1 Tax=Tanacetum coccineum TaxID=301880 RepID=A0ABQ5FKR2_9ASTR
MITYLKNMEGWKHKELKPEDFDSIKELFDKAFTRQKVDEDKDTTELQSLMEVIPDEEEVAIDVVPLATKSPSIVDWKIYKEGKKSYYQIVRADGKSQMYRVFSQMLKSFTREDLEDPYKLVKAKYESSRLVEDLDLVLWNDLKTMFKPHVEDEIRKLQQRYPLTPPTITDMLNNKLQGRIVGIKSLLNAASITTALIDVNAAQSKKLLLLEEVTTASGINAAEGVNAASEEVSTAELVSTAYLKEFDLLKWDQQVVSELVALRNFARRYGSRFCTHGGCIQSSHAQTGSRRSVLEENIYSTALVSVMAWLMMIELSRQRKGLINALMSYSTLRSDSEAHDSGYVVPYLTDYEEKAGGINVAFGGNLKGGNITKKSSRTRVWLFDIDALTRTMNYEPIVAGTQSNGFAGTKASDNAGQARKETEPVKDYILLPLWTADPPYSQDPKSSHDDGSKPSSDDGKKVDEDPRKDSECNDQEKEDNVNSTNNVNAASTNEVNAVGGKTSIELPFDPNMPALEDYSIFDFSRDDEDDGAEADMNNLDTTIQVSPIPTIRIHKDHPLDQVIGELCNHLHKPRMIQRNWRTRVVSNLFNKEQTIKHQNCLFALLFYHWKNQKR